MEAYLVYQDWSYTHMLNCYAFEIGPDCGFMCGVEDFERVKQHLNPFGTMGLEEDIDGQPICTDWLGDFWLTFDWENFERCASLSLFEVRDENCYFSLDLNLSAFLPQGTRVDIDDEWRIPMNTLLHAVRTADEQILSLVDSMDKKIENNVSFFFRPKEGECPVCFVQTSCAFSCGHRLCEHCFLKMKEIKNSIECPICRKQILSEISVFE